MSVFMNTLQAASFSSDSLPVYYMFSGKYRYPCLPLPTFSRHRIMEDSMEFA